MSLRLPLVLVLAGGLFGCCPLAAQTPAPVPGDVAAAPRRVVLGRAAVPIKVDGRLDEASWQVADALRDLRQQDPREGAPGSEETEVRFLVDDRALYIGIRAFEQDPALINARELRRDADFRNDDKIEILLDTFHDRRSAYRFAVNALGTQQDALVTDDGRVVTLQWDAAWISAAQIDDRGWTAELAIPLSSLRFTEGNTAWGLNVARVTRRTNEEALWTSWQRALGLERVSQAGELTGTEIIRSRQLVEVKPYASGALRRAVTEAGSVLPDDGTAASAGIEVARIGVTPSLTFEGTVNPDFGQAEVDAQVINFTRFSIFFPERRDFFLENAGYFLFGTPGETQLFFSRRVGLTDNALPLPIDYGAKLTGRVGSTSVGFLRTQTRSAGTRGAPGFASGEAVTVARVKQDLGRRSYVGAMGVLQTGGGPSFVGAGLDALVQPSSYWQLSGYWMRGVPDGATAAGRDAWRVSSDYETDRWRVRAAVEEIGQDFAPPTGFAQRNGFRQYFSEVAYKPRPAWWKAMRQFEVETQNRVYVNPAGLLETRRHELSFYGNFQSSAFLFVRPVEYLVDVPPADFTIAGVTVPAGRYEFNRPYLRFSSNRSKRLVWNVRLKVGGFYGGTREEAGGGATWRPDSHLLLDASYGYNRLRLPGGGRDTHLITTRAEFNPSRAVLTAVLVQFNSAAQLTQLNARLRFNFRPFSDLFVVYNLSTGAGVERPSHQLQLKATYDLVF